MEHTSSTATYGTENPIKANERDVSLREPQMEVSDRQLQERQRTKMAEPKERALQQKIKQLVSEFQQTLQQKDRTISDLQQIRYNSWCQSFSRACSRRTGQSVTSSRPYQPTRGRFSNWSSKERPTMADLKTCMHRSQQQTLPGKLQSHQHLRRTAWP